MPERPKSGPCTLCGRHTTLTFHHLIPRKVHRRTYFRKHHDRETLQQGIDVCRLCHYAIHRLYDEMTLARRFASLQALRDDPAIQRHVAWARKQRTHSPNV